MSKELARRLQAATSITRPDVAPAARDVELPKYSVQRAERTGLLIVAVVAVCLCTWALVLTWHNVLGAVFERLLAM